MLSSRIRGSVGKGVDGDRRRRRHSFLILGHRDRRLGDLDVTDHDQHQAHDLRDEEPAEPQLLVEQHDPVGDADQRVTDGQHRLRGGQRAGLERILQQEQRADPGDGHPVQLPGGEERRRAPVERRHGLFQQRRGERVPARGGQAEQRGARLAADPQRGRDEHGLEGAGRDQGQDPGTGGRVVVAAARLGRRQPGAQADRDQRDRPPGARGQPAVPHPAAEQQGQRQLDDEDGLDQRDGAGGQGPGLQQGGHDDHADPSQPDLAVQQVGDQPQPERT